MSSLTALLILLMLPFLWLLQTSFRPMRRSSPSRRRSSSGRPSRTTRAVGFGLPHSFANSLTVGVVSTVRSMLIGVPAAYALSRWTSRASNTINLWILASRVAPPIAFTIPYFLVYRHLELSTR